jgi:hypothetical protein
VLVGPEDLDHLAGLQHYVHRDLSELVHSLSPLPGTAFDPSL